MTAYFYYGIVYFIEAIILFMYCNNFFVLKRDKRTGICVYVVIFAAMIPAAYFGNIYINGILFVLAQFFIIYFLYRTSAGVAFFNAVMLTVLMSLCEIIVAALFPRLTYDYGRNVDIISSSIIVTAVLTKFFYFFIVQVLCHVFKKQANNIVPRNMGAAAVSLVSVISLAIAVIICSLIDRYSPESAVSYMLAIILLLFLLINIIIYGIQRYSQKKADEYSVMQLQLQRENDSIQYYKMLAKQNENQNILIHDIKNHFRIIKKFNTDGEYDKLNEYLDNITENTGLKRTLKYCDNEILNAVIYRYVLICEENNIKISVDIQSGVINFIRDDDCASLFYNLLDNAYEACAGVKSASIELYVRDMRQTGNIIINIINSCRRNPFDKNGRLITHKKSGGIHGIGLKSVNKAVDKYEGNIEQYYGDDCRFHTVVTLRKNVHSR